MKYKPTKEFTLKNIADMVHETGCDEAKAEFFDALYELKQKGSTTDIDEQEVCKGSDLWYTIVKTEKRRSWLLKHGFIEEESERLKYKSLDPIIANIECPYCGIIYTYSDLWRSFVTCTECKKEITIE